jgi:hypothetical protein
MKLAIIGLIAIGFSGCATEYKTLKIGTINSSKKTITLPSLGNAMFDIKSVLIQNGWKIKVGNAELEETGINNKRVNVNTKIKFDTEYRLNMTTTTHRSQIRGFNLTVVNNKTNEEVINMLGKVHNPAEYQPEDIAKRLIQALNEVEK